jgi:hypothetical protein
MSNFWYLETQKLSCDTESALSFLFKGREVRYYQLASVCAYLKDDFISIDGCVANILNWAGLMGPPCGTDARLHLYCGWEQSLWILVTKGVQCGGGGVVHGRAWNLTFRQRILSVWLWPGSAWGSTWLFSTSSSIVRAVKALLDHKTSCRLCFVLLVCGASCI